MPDAQQKPEAAPGTRVSGKTKPAKVTKPQAAAKKATAEPAAVDPPRETKKRRTGDKENTNDVGNNETKKTKAKAPTFAGRRRAGIRPLATWKWDAIKSAFDQHVRDRVAAPSMYQVRLVVVIHNLMMQFSVVCI